jgi:HEPN domain-containing protein
MSDRESRRSSVREWIEIAEQDWWAVETAIAADPPKLLIAVFHAQQTGEKYLKAFLVWQGAHFPKTHDLKVLLELSLPFDAGLISLRPACFRLSELGVEPRYPMPGPPIGLPQAREAEADAKLVREAIRALMADALGEG